MATEYALIADIGGTHARFALRDETGALHHVSIISDTEHDDLFSLYQAYRAHIAQEDCVITKAILAVAGPVTGDKVTITNRGWHFSQQELQAQLQVADLVVMNDFKALALALPHLTRNDTQALYTPKESITEPAPMVVVGPGTGLGVAMMVPLPDGGWLPVAGEGGHVMLAARNPDEEQIIAGLAQKFDYVSAEYALSGQGLVNIYRVMADDEGVYAPCDTPQAVVEAAQQGDAMAQNALTQFCAFLGNVVGDAALTAGAVGGIYLAGGILPYISDILRRSEFLQRVQQRGVASPYIKTMPIWLITAPVPAFIGLQHFESDSKE